MKPPPLAPDTRTIYVTKYALSRGILRAEAEVREERQAATVRTDRGSFCFRGNDWHLTLEGARARLRVLRDRKVSALRKQLLELEALEVAGATATPYAAEETMSESEDA